MKRSGIFLLSLFLCLLILSCGNSRQSSSNVPTTDFRSPDPVYAAYDLGRPAVVTIYNFSSTVADDRPEVIALANERFFKPILNTTVDLVLLPAADTRTRYPLLLAGGEDVDIIFTAPWRYYNEESAKGSFVEITDDFLNRWLPKTKTIQPAISWEQAKINGQVFGVPTSYNNWEHKFTMIREDLREKYNLPVLDSWAALENYEFTVSRLEDGVLGYNTAATTWELMNVYMQDRDILLTPQPVYFAWHHQGREPRPEELDFYYTSTWYKDYARTMARWYANGVWSRNVMNNTVSVRDAFVQGQSASMFWNDVLLNIGNTMESNGFGKAGYYDISPHAIVRRRSYDTNLWAIASTSDNIERAALVVDLMKSNSDLVYLLKIGIEGRHWISQPNNTFSPGPDVAKYPYDHWTGALAHPGDKRLFYGPEVPQQWVTLMNNYDSRIADFEVDGFRINVTPMAAEWVVMSALVDEYRTSFECGVFGDQIEAKLVEFETKLKAAGVDRLITMVRNDYATYLRNFQR